MRTTTLTSRDACRTPSAAASGDLAGDRYPPGSRHPAQASPSAGAQVNRLHSVSDELTPDSPLPHPHPTGDEPSDSEVTEHLLSHALHLRIDLAAASNQLVIRGVRSCIQTALTNDIYGAGPPLGSSYTTTGTQSSGSGQPLGTSAWTASAYQFSPLGDSPDASGGARFSQAAGQQQQQRQGLGSTLAAAPMSWVAEGTGFLHRKT